MWGSVAECDNTKVESHHHSSAAVLKSDRFYGYGSGDGAAEYSQMSLPPFFVASFPGEADPTLLDRAKMLRRPSLPSPSFFAHSC